LEVSRAVSRIADDYAFHRNRFGVSADQGEPFMMSGLSGRGVIHGVVIIACLSVPPSVFAQEVGVKAGVNSAYLTPEEDEDPDDSWRLGVVGGLWVRIAPSNRVSFQAEGLFSEKGVKFKAPALGLESADIRLRYLEIPLLARIDFGAAGASPRVFVVGGGAPSFKLGTRAKSVFEGTEASRDIDDDIYSTDFGLVGGLGVEFGRASIEGRYTHGIRHINTDDNGDEDRIKNRVFSVTVGFRLQ
jgi:hypothetical protein